MCHLWLLAKRFINDLLAECEPPQSIVTASLLRFEDIMSDEDMFAKSLFCSFTTHFFGTLAKGN